MRQFLINSISISEQCHSITDAGKIFNETLDCLKYIWPMVNKGYASLMCASDIEKNSLIKGEAFKSTLSRLKSINGDIPRLWYQYTVNRPYEDELPIAVKVDAVPHCGISKTGVLSAIFLNPKIYWISFGGEEFNESSSFFVDCGQQGKFSVTNAYNEFGVAATLPRFKHHSKHREESYYDYERNENVAAMPIRDEGDAGILLRNGLNFGSDIISYHGLSNRIFRFKLTGGNVYHGFEIEPSEIPANFLEALKQ